MNQQQPIPGPWEEDGVHITHFQSIGVWPPGSGCGGCGDQLFGFFG